MLRQRTAQALSEIAQPCRHGAHCRAPHCLIAPVGHPGPSLVRVCQGVLLARRPGLKRDPGEQHLLETDDGRTLIVMSIRYADTFVKHDDTWLFAERKLIIDWTDTRPSQP
jgi:hypothetical protein